MNRFLSLFFVAVLSVLIGTGCSTSSEANLEKAQFNLDNGEYSAAIKQAQKAIDDDNANYNAYRVLGSAYILRANVDLLDVLIGIIGIYDDQTVNNYVQVKDTLTADTDLSDIRDAVSKIEQAPDLDQAKLENDAADLAYDLATFMSIEIFAIPLKQIGALNGDTIDVEKITQADADTVKKDLLKFDDYFVNSQAVEEGKDFLQEIRQTHCVLKYISDDGKTFTLDEYRAFIGCQLDPKNFDPSKYIPGAICDDLDPDNQVAKVNLCNLTNTTND